MSESTGKSNVFQFPISKEGRVEQAPAWFEKGGATARKAMFGQPGSGGATVAPMPSIPNSPSMAARSIDTPPPGSKSQPPPPPEPLNAQAVAELEQSVRAFAGAALELGAARAKMLAAMEGQVIDLAMEIASAMVEKEIDADPELHGAMAKEALKALGDLEDASLRASPAAVDAIREVYGDTKVVIDGVSIEVEVDANIEGLGCIAENDEVRVDGRVDERIRSVRRAIEDERRQKDREEESE